EDVDARRELVGSDGPTEPVGTGVEHARKEAGAHVLVAGDDATALFVLHVKAFHVVTRIRLAHDAGHVQREASGGGGERLPPALALHSRRREMLRDGLEALRSSAPED